MLLNHKILYTWKEEKKGITYLNMLLRALLTPIIGKKKRVSRELKGLEGNHRLCITKKIVEKRKEI